MRLEPVINTHRVELMEAWKQANVLCKLVWLETDWAFVYFLATFIGKTNTRIGEAG